ncbi:MAG: hypothetical protein ACREDY_02325, partial [Bradyrhizobium sp.]
SEATSTASAAEGKTSSPSTRSEPANVLLRMEFKRSVENLWTSSAYLVEEATAKNFFRRGGRCAATFARGFA